MSTVHPGLDLEHEGAERTVERARDAVDVGPRTGRGRELEQGVEQLADPEVQDRRPEQHGRGDARQEALLVVHLPHRVEQLALLDRDPPGVTLALGSRRGRDPLLGGDRRAAGGAGEAQEVAGRPLQDAAEVAGDADRPGQRGGLQAGALADLVHQRERLEPGSVPLVDDRQDRDLAVPADVEQLHRLRLEALGRIEQHHRRVDRGEHPVGVLGEVGVTRRVEQVDDRVAVRELQRRRADRDAAGLLHVHPVGHGGLAARLAVDRPGLLDDPRVQRQRLGERRLAGIGVADDGEGPAPHRLGGRRVRGRRGRGGQDGPLPRSGGRHRTVGP